MGIIVKFDKSAAIARIKAANGKALTITTEQALKDCNYYCKQDQSGLINSSITASEPEKGVMKWHTPYARRQYYLKSTSKDVNSNAEWMWAHKAQSMHGKEWLKTYQNAIKKGLK